MEDKKVIRGTFPVRWHKDGQDGKDGTNVWMKYAKTLDKGTYPSTMYDTFSSDMNYIGIGNGRGAEPTDPSKYAWKKIKGEDGTSFTAKGNAIAHYANKADFEAATKTVGLYLYDDSAGAKLVQWNGSEPTEMSVATGDAYTTSDMHLWVRDETKWVDLGMIQGPAGTPGDDGESYWIVPSSETVPLNSSGYPISASISATAWRKIGKTNAEQIKQDEEYNEVNNREGYTLSVAAHYADGTGSEVTQMYDNGTVTLSYTRGKVVQSVTMKLKKGETTLLDIRNLVPSYDGKNGIDGKNAIRLDLDNENDTMLYDSNGQRVSGDIITNAYLYDGATKVESGVTYEVDSSEGCTYDHEPNSNQFTVTGMTAAATVGWLRIKATYNRETYLATLTLKKIVGQCKYDIVTSVSAITKDANTGTLSPATVTAYIRKTDASGKVTTTQYTEIDGKKLQVYNGVNWSDVSGTSINTSGHDLILRISDGTYVYDQETLPLIISGKNGTNGNDAVSYWLDCSHMAVPCTSDGKARSDVSITIKAWKKIGDNAPEQLDLKKNYVKYRFNYKDYGENETTFTEGYVRENLSISPDASRVLRNVVITLEISGKIIQTITLLPVLDGPKGSAGYDYIPDVLGLWDSTHAYKWNNIKREGFLYLSNGSYDLYYVKNRMTTVDAGTEPTNDQYFVKASKWYTIYTEALYTPNANIGGFFVTAGKFMSAENAYALRYFGSFDSTNSLLYRGTWSGSNTYATNHLVLYNGVYYYSVISNNTSTPSSSSSSWRKCSNVWITRINEASPSIGQTIYLYEYDNATLKRPVVKDGSTYYTIKKMGAATAMPTSSNSNWRELTDTELSSLNVGNGAETTPPVSYVPKYTLNGKNGTVMMLQNDDTCWTYDETGKQVNGIPYGKRIEIVPASKSIDVYDDNGDLALQVNGDTYDTIDKAYGSGTLNPSCSVVNGQLTSLSAGSTRTIQSLITPNSFKVSDYPLAMSIDCSFKITATEIRTTTTPSGNYGNITSVPYYAGNEWVYRNDCQGTIIVQKQNPDDLTWSNSTQLITLTTVGKSGTISRYSGVLSCVLQPGTYRLVFVFTASLFGTYNTGSSSSDSYCKFDLTYVRASGNYAIKTSRVFSNGLAFGSATNNNFVVCREKEGIHVKASTSSNYGFELSQSKGLEVKRGGQQGIVPVLLYAGRAAYLSNGQKSQKTIYQYSDGDVTYSWKHIGICEITFPWDCDPEKCVPTVTTWQGVTGVSARIVSWYVRKITIEIDNDYSSGAGTGSDHDYGGFYIKLEYIG